MITPLLFKVVGLAAVPPDIVTAVLVFVRVRLPVAVTVPVVLEGSVCAVELFPLMVNCADAAEVAARRESTARANDGRRERETRIIGRRGG